MSIFNKIWFVLDKEDKKRIFFLFFLMFFAMLIETFSIGLILPVISLIVDPSFFLKLFNFFNLENYYYNFDQETLIYYSLICLIIVFIIKNVFLSFFYWLQFSIAYGAQRNISKKLFDSYLRAEYNFHISRNSAKLIRNITTETSQFTLSILSSLIFFTECLVIFGLLLFLLFIDPISTILLASVFVIFGASFQRVTRKLIGLWGENRHLYEGIRIQNLHQGLGGIKEVKLYGREKEFLSMYDKNNLGLSRMLRNIKFMNQLPRMVIETLAVFIIFLIISITLISNKELITIIPILGLFGASATRIIPSVNRIINAIQSIRFSVPVINMLNNEIKNIEDIKREKLIANNDKINFKNKIVLENISFKYQNSDKYILKEVNISIKKGDCIGIIGKSGQGKSTFVDLITGLLTQTTGRILIDDQEITKNLRAYQNIIGYVPQNIYLLDSSIKENIAFGNYNQQKNIELINSILEKVELSSFVNELPHKLDTKLGERGVKISGGQIQRIGIARAIFNDPSIIIFDEATSALDKETEKKILDSINNFKSEKTILIISHDYKTLGLCDKIYKIEETSITRKD